MSNNKTEGIVNILFDLFRGPEFKIDLEYKNYNVEKSNIEGDFDSIMMAIAVILDNLKNNSEFNRVKILTSIFDDLECSEEEVKKAYAAYRELQDFKELCKDTLKDWRRN